MWHVVVPIGTMYTCNIKKLYDSSCNRQFGVDVITLFFRGPPYFAMLNGIRPHGHHNLN